MFGCCVQRSAFALNDVEQKQKCAFLFCTNLIRCDLPVAVHRLRKLSCAGDDSHETSSLHLYNLHFGLDFYCRIKCACAGGTQVQYEQIQKWCWVKLTLIHRIKGKVCLYYGEWAKVRSLGLQPQMRCTWQVCLCETSDVDREV